MKSWKLTSAKEYKLFTSEQNQSVEDNYFDDEALKKENTTKVKLLKANLDQNDINAYLGKGGISYPLVPSRSAVGLVSDNDNHEFDLGERVFLAPYLDHSKTSPKLRGYNEDGYLSDFTYALNSSIFPLPEGVSDDEALFTEDIALCISCHNKLDIEKGDYILLYGASYLNILFAQIAIYYQLVPVIVDNDEDRLSIAQNAGVYYTIDTREENAERKSIEITSGDMYKALIIDLDNFTVANDYVELIRDGGTICLYGYSKNNINMVAQLDLVLTKGLNIIGVNNGNGEIHSAINLLANKVINIEYLIESSTPFNNFVQIMKNISDKSNPLKHTITFD